MSMQAPGNRAEYKRDGSGRLVPLANVKPEHLLEEELVLELHRRAEALSAEIAAFKAHCFENIDALLEMLASKYGATRRSQKGNFSLASYDGDHRVQVAVGDLLSFGPELQVAKELIDECLTEWAEGGNPNLKAVVNDAFDVGKEGKLRVDRILALRRIEIADPRWQKAMAAIGDALRVISSTRYVRFHRRRDGGPYQQILLDISKA